MLEGVTKGESTVALGELSHTRIAKPEKDRERVPRS
jgi:hypothetical protein